MMDLTKLIEVLSLPKDLIKKHPYILGFLAITVLVSYVIINEQRHQLSEDKIRSLKNDAGKSLQLTKIIQAQVGALKDGFAGLPLAVSSIRTVLTEAERARAVKGAMQVRLHDSLKALEVQVGIIDRAVTTVTAMSRSIDIYENGVRSEKEGRYREAAQHYREAADAGVAEAQFRLGQLYFGGQGVDQDINQATALYEQAALMGIQDAKDALADIYYKGHGVERDPSRAIAVLSLLPQSKKQLVQFERIAQTLSGPEYQRAAKLTAEYQNLQRNIVLGISNLEGG